MTGSPLTSPAVERAVAALLGADDELAARVVEALSNAGRLKEGIALHALLLAARRGDDACGAMAAITAGADLAQTWSAYERRVAAEEAVDDLRVPLARGEGQTLAAGSDAPLVVVRALQAGASRVLAGAEAATRLDGLAAHRAQCDHAFVERLARRAGARVEPRPDTGSVPSVEPVDGTVTRSDAYIDVFADG